MELWLLMPVVELLFKQLADPKEEGWDLKATFPEVVSAKMDKSDNLLDVSVEIHEVFRDMGLTYNSIRLDPNNVVSVIGVKYSEALVDQCR